MSKLNRRQILLAGLATGAASSGILKALPATAQTAEPLSKTKQNAGSNDLLEYDGNTQTGGENRIGSDVNLTPPNLPYDHQISQLLVLCTLLAIEQYEESKNNPNYDGSIRSLPSYDQQLDNYTQIASFDSFQSSPNPLGDVGELIDRLRSGKRSKVFLGFALTSSQHNIIAFRGTQNAAEWLGNLRAKQSELIRNGSLRGNVHRGFFDLYDKIDDQILTAAAQFSPNLPCYITGHSLGGALATLAALDIVTARAALKSQVQLYTYASPRVGDPTFAQFHSSMVPNSYRVINLSDSVPMTPPSQIKQLKFRHIGQQWGFVYQTGDMVPNHAIWLYQAAIAKQVETSDLNSYVRL